jgi:DnaJ-class molecular chaperone
VSDDPYKILGVEKTAAQDEIQRAYRSLAKKLHPDLNPGNKKAEEQFKEIARAYDIVGDPAKRKRFDDGEIDGQGSDRPRQRPYRDYADSTDNPYATAAGFSDFEGADDLFSELFRRGAGSGQSGFKARGGDLQYRLVVDFVDAINGAKTQISLPDGSTLEVSLPPGVREGQTLRLRGKGRPGQGGGPAGDALVAIEVRPHQFFTRKGNDIYVDLSIPLADAVLGAKIDVPTPSGLVQMAVPKWSNTGATLRLRGKGAPNKDGGHGDEYVILKIMLPAKPDADLEALITQWSATRASKSSAKEEA